MDAYVTKPEFDRVVADHERRLGAHDSLFRDIREAREELIAFSQTLRHVRENMDKGEIDCVRISSGFEKRIKSLEKFRWMFSGAVLVFAAIPSWAALIWKLVG